MSCSKFANFFLKKQSAIQQQPAAAYNRGGRNVIVLPRKDKSDQFFRVLLAEIQPSVVNKKCQAVYICNTRQLAAEVHKCMSAQAVMAGIKVELIIGKGRSVRQDQRILNAGGIGVIVGTPGRLRHLLTLHYLALNDVRFLCLDDAYELNRGRCDLGSVYRLRVAVPKTAQTVMLFSMTSIGEKFWVEAHFPPHITWQYLTLERTAHVTISAATTDEKMVAINKLLSTHRSVIFCNSVASVNDRLQMLHDGDFHAISMEDIGWGNDKSLREKFLAEGFDILVATTEGFTRHLPCFYGLFPLIIHFDAVGHVDDYIHRAGHTSGQRAPTIIVNFANQSSAAMLKDIEEHYNIRMVDATKFNNFFKVRSGVLLREYNASTRMQVQKEPLGEMFEEEY